MYTVLYYHPLSRTDFTKLWIHNHKLKSNVEDYEFKQAEFFT